MLKKIFALVIVGFVSITVVSASDFTSVTKEIKGIDYELQKLSTQISTEESKSRKNNSDLKLLTDKKTKLEENRNKKINDLKDTIQKNINTIKTQIEKAKEQKADSAKLDEKLKKHEEELSKLSSDYPLTPKPEKKEKEEEKKDDKKDDKKKDDKKKDDKKK